jgi:hypothetical protein
MTPAIELFGITIHEPVTSATDWLVTGVAWWLGSKLWRIRDDRRPLTFPWGVGFWMIGLGALVGGTSHAFAAYLDDTASFWVWKATIYSIALSVTLALAGTINAVPVRDRFRRILHGVNIVVFTAYAAWMLDHSAFKYVIWHYVPIMLSIAALHAFSWSRERRAGELWIIAGVVTTLAGAAIQRSGFTIHAWFNHNDLYHVVQVFGLYLFYTGLTKNGREPVQHAPVG